MMFIDPCPMIIDSFAGGGGNSVCPQLAVALVRANCAHLMVREEAA